METSTTGVKVMKGVTRPCADFAESKDVDAKAITSQHRACAKTDFYGSFDFWEVAGFSSQRGRVRFPHGSYHSAKKNLVRRLPNEAVT